MQEPTQGSFDGTWQPVRSAQAARWPAQCKIEGCERKHYGKGLCKPCYRKQWQQANQQRLAEYDRKRNQDPKRKEAERQRNHSAKKKASKQAWIDRTTDWGAWWEKQRKAEDEQDIARFADERGLPAPRLVAQGKAAQRVSRRPRTRQFIMGWCVDCPDAFVVVEGWWHGSTRCSRCTDRLWKGGDHLARARRYGVPYEPIDPKAIFKRDGYRCQICGRKTKGKPPDPRAPSLDHIVPMARGGGHVEHNVQCACWLCNSAKGAGSANDQLRLALFQ